MSPIKISLKSLAANPLTSLLNVLLIAFGTGILCVILLASTQISKKLANNAKDIDLVVGAKGSPLQLILSSIFYIDFPTGNISLSEANKLAHNPMVKRAVPLALGDNSGGFRIVGTDTSFIHLYGLELASGNFWAKDFEVTIGSVVANSLNLKVGDQIFGAHGLTEEGDLHKEHNYTVAGILSPLDNVTDNLILTNIESILKMHGVTANGPDSNGVSDTQITSLLIQYHSPMSVILFPRMVNETTHMQAASPARESARLFSLIGIGIDTLKWFAVLIMIIAVISVFISLYNSLKERKYDLAIMRTIGASRGKLFTIIIFEGAILTFIGSVTGLLVGHFALEFIGRNQDSTQAQMTGYTFLTDEIYLLIVGLFIGVLAAMIPAIQAFRSDISKTLSKN